MPPKAYPQVAKARFYKGENAPAEDSPQSIKVHFNPESLQYDMTNALESKTERGRAVQYVTQSTAKLSLECVYDSTNDGTDVRNYTKKVLNLMAPDPQGTGRNNGTARKVPSTVTFEWGAFRFKGYIESYKEVLDFFSPDGVPLRAKLNLVLAENNVDFAAATRDSGRSFNMSAVSFTPPAGATISNLTQQGGGDDTGRETAEDNNVEDPKNPPPDQELVVDGDDSSDEDGGSANDLAAPEGFDGNEVSGGAGVAAAAGGGFGGGAGAGFGASAGASAGFGASAGASFGASAGVSAGFGASAGASFGASAGVSAGFGASAGASFGASAGASFGASAGASAGFGASAGASFGASAGASAGFGASAGASAGFGASAGASAGFGAGASAGFGASAGASAGFGASAGASFGASAGASSSFGSSSSFSSSYSSSYSASYSASASASGVATIVSGSGRSSFTSNSARWNMEAGLRTRYEGLRFEQRRSTRRVNGERLLSSLSAEQGIPASPDTFLPGGQALYTESGIRADVHQPLDLRSSVRFEEG